MVIEELDSIKTDISVLCPQGNAPQLVHATDLKGEASHVIYSHISSIVRLGLLVYWGLTPQQQPGSYRGSVDDNEMSVSPVEETGAPGRKHRPTACHFVRLGSEKEVKG